MPGGKREVNDEIDNEAVTTTFYCVNVVQSEQKSLPNNRLTKYTRLSCHYIPRQAVVSFYFKTGCRVILF